MSIENFIENAKPILDSLSDMAIILDNQRNIVFANKTMVSRLGINQDQLIAHKCYEYIHGTDQPSETCPCSALLNGEEEHEIEIQENILGGYCHIKCSSIRDENGAIIGSIHLINYIDGIGKDEEYFTTFVEKSWDGILLVNNQAKITYTNPSIERITGYKTDELFNSDVFSFVSPEDHDKAYSIFDNLLQKKAETVSMELRIRHKNGSLIWIDGNVINLLDDPRVNAFFINYRDITERKEAELLLKIQYDLNFQLASISDTKEACDAILQACIQIKDIDCGGVYLVNQDTQSVDLIDHIGLTENYVRELSHYDANSINAQMVMNGVSAYFAHEYINNMFPAENIIHQENLRAVAMIPFAFNNQVIGCLNLASHYADNISSNERLVIESIASRLGPTIIRMQTIEKLAKSEEHYRKLFTQMLNGSATHQIICDSDGKAIDYITLDVNPAFESMLNIKRDDIVGKKISEILPQEELSDWLEVFGSVAINGGSSRYEMYSPFYKRYYEGIAYCPEIGKFAVIVSDITERKLMDDEKEITIKLLRLLNDNNNLHELMREIANLLQDWSGCEAVGIRLNDGDDYPYFETHGFPSEFVQLENKLCKFDELGELIRDSEGDPLLECMCGNIIKGRFNPKLPFFTEFGSFWTNSTTKLLASTSEKDRQSNTRNRCNGMGYESVALIPLHIAEGCLGLLQFNDKREGQFTKNKIEVLERLANSLSIAMSQRKAAKELKDTEQILETIFNSTHIHVAYLDPQFNFIKVNNAYAKADDKDESYFIGKNHFNLYPNEENEAIFKQVVETGQPYFSYSKPFVYYHNPERGITYWDFSLVPIKDSENNIISLVLSLENVTEQKLKQTEYQTIIHASIDGLVIGDIDGNLLDVNDAYCQMVGYTRDELLNMNAIDIVADKTKEEFTHNINKIIELNHKLFESKHRCKNGMVIDVEVSATYDKYNEKYYTFIRDITERKKAENLLIESEAKYRNLYETMSQGIVYQNSNGSITEANSAAEKILGLTLDQMQGKTSIDPNWRSVREDGSNFPGNEHPSMVALMTGRRVDNVVMGVFNPSIQKQRWILINAVPHFRPGEDIPYEVYTTFDDITGRKLAEDRLKDSEAKYRTLFDSLADSIYIHDLDGHILEVNKMASSKLGYSHEELLNMSLKDIDSPESTKSIPLKIKQVIEKGHAFFESENITKNGETIPVEVNSRIIDYNGKIAILGIARDITDRKQTEKALIDSEEKYRALVENSPDVIMRFDKDARFVYVNPSITKETGMLPNEYIGKKHRDFNVPESVCEFWEQAISKVFNTKKAYEEEAQFQGINGLVIYNLRILPEFNENGDVKTVLSIARDVTEYRKTEKSYRDMFNTMTDGFTLHELIYDESGNPVDTRFIDVNPAFEKLTGLSRDLVVGNTALGVWYGQEPYGVDTYSKVALTGEPAHFENYSKELDKYFDVTVYSPQKGQFATIFSDVTERKQSEELQTKLQQTSKMESIGRLAGGVAHDFNNMLTVIQGSASLAMMDLNHKDPLYNRLEMIEEASERASELTRQLLAFSRKQIIELKDINLNDIITNLRKMLGRLIGEDIELHVFLSENIFNINADPGQMEQVIINLAVNSRDAMPNGGKLTIETSNVHLDHNYCMKHPETKEGSYVQMTISDNGCGMSEETKKHIFEPFFTTKKAGEGTGLGLATVYGIIKQHNGSIEFYSELGHGTTFKIYLPQINNIDVNINDDENDKDTIVALTGNETILLVEDDNIVREITSEFLKQLGYKALIAENGGSALIITEQYNQRIDLLMTDVVMPGINGRELSERLLKIHPEMKVLYTSGYTQNVIAHHGVLEEGINFIGKPYRLEALAKKIRKVLARVK